METDHVYCPPLSIPMGARLEIMIVECQVLLNKGFRILVNIIVLGVSY